MNDKRKKAKLFGLFVLLFAVLLLVSEVAVVVVNNIASKQAMSAYEITLIIMPAIALILTGIIVWIFYSLFKNAEILMNGLDRVAQGDFKTRLEVKRHSSFAKISENFNKMAKELNSVNTLREDFVRNVSHEIKTPLCSIQGFASLLLEGGATEEEQRKYLTVIAEEADRLRRFADGVLALSKFENQQIAGEMEKVKLDVQIRDCVIMLQREWEKKNIEVSLDLIPLTVNTDGSLLRNVWINLLSNAIKYTPEGGRVEVSLKKENGKAVAVFRDNGAGIAQEDLPHIFEKFYRSPSVKSAEGYGVGLAICKRICTLLEGSVSCRSEKGKGSAFKVVLPV